MNFAPWEACRACSSGPQPGAVALLAWCREVAPQGRSMGIFYCRPVRGGSSLSLHSCGRALDWGMPMEGGRGSSAGHGLVSWIGSAGRRLGVQAIIYDRRIWSARSPNGRAYTGVAPHYDHLHIELTAASARNLTLATLRSVLGGSQAATNEEDDVYVVRHDQRGARVERAQRIIQAAGRTFGEDLLPRFGADGHYGDETASAVNVIARRARLDEDGGTGMDALVLDYCRMLLESSRSGGGGGMSQADADARYVRQGTTVQVRL